MHPSTALDSPPVLHLVWNLIRGGTEGQCARVALQLPHQRVAVFRREGYFLDPVEQRCGPVYPLDIQSIKSPRTLWLVWKLAQYVRRERLAGLHAWDADAAVFGSIAARWAGVPLITSRRDLGEIYAGWKRRLMDRADRRAAAVVVNAEAIREQCLARGLPADRVVTIPNVLDVDEFDRQAASSFTALSGGHRWVVVVARLDPEKDHEMVLRIAQRLRDSHPDVCFALAGDGVERERLLRRATELEVADRVRLLGDISAVPACLRRCTIGLLTPSANEGLSNTILEYMAARLPVVATDCGGNRELVRGGKTGYLVPVGDDEMAAEYVARLLDDPNHAAALGEAGRAVIEARHRPETVVAEFATLYRRAFTTSS